nr:MAG TPA: Protein of unknown function (DUF1642) [Caudoviricetes sp.]
MEKQDLIKEINKEKYDFSKPETSLNSSDYKEGYNDASDDILDIIKKLDEPQKVKVPQFVAKWISKCQELNWNLSDLLAPEIFDSTFAFNTKEWLRQDKQNYDILARAWLDGYEVEEEPKYTMPVPYVSYPVHYSIRDDGVITFTQGNPQTFTQAELDKYFPDIKQFAVPVEKV